jgi:dTDP-4-dehydrorhamnose 3,5-epimerase-like enzyme
MIDTQLSAKTDTLPTMQDARGSLTVAELNQFVPFAVTRIFYVRDVPRGTMRGGHAHYKCSQYMICQSGRLSITLTDGAKEQTVALSPGEGLFVAPGIFASETYVDASSVMLVLCDRPYEKEDYIHTMEEYRKYRAETRSHDAS